MRSGSQLISEPHREAMLEICSGTEDPDLKDAASSPLKESLRGLGFHPGGGCAGFQKPVRVESPDDCRLLAKEIAGLITGCLGYEPSGPIVFNKTFGERAEHARVFHSIRMGDIERLLRSSGLVLWQIDGRPDIGYRTVDRPRFEVRPFAEVPPGSGSYRALQFAFAMKCELEGAEEAAWEVGRKHAFGIVSIKDGVVTITHSVLTEGGLTEANLRFHLYLWRRLLDRVVESYDRRSDEDDG